MVPRLSRLALATGYAKKFRPAAIGVGRRKPRGRNQNRYRAMSSYYVLAWLMHLSRQGGLFYVRYWSSYIN